MADLYPVARDIQPGFVIRKHRLEDVASLASSANHGSVAQFLLPHFPYPYTVDHARSWIDHHLAHYKEQQSTDKPLMGAWAIATAPASQDQESTVIGVIGLIPSAGFYRRDAEIGFWLTPAFWGRGLMAAAVKLHITAIRHAYPHQLTRLSGKAFAANTASQRVLTKCGFVLEGLHKQYVLDRNDRLQDEAHYAYVFAGQLDA